MFPHYKDKQSLQAFVTPEKYIEYLKSKKKINDDFPKDIIIAYHSSVLDYVKKKYVVSHNGFLNVIRIENKKIGIVDSKIGAPALAVLLEELIVLGASRFISVGLAGSLSEKATIGSWILADRAIRDEGTSWHYLDKEVIVYPDGDLTKKLLSYFALDKKNILVGGTWTTDAPYRETKEEINRYQSQGFLTVEMEASLLFTLGHIKNISTAALFVISDGLYTQTWNPAFFSNKVNLNELVDSIIGFYKEI